MGHKPSSTRWVKGVGSKSRSFDVARDSLLTASHNWFCFPCLVPLLVSSNPVSPATCHCCGKVLGFLLFPPSLRAAPQLGIDVAAGVFSLEAGCELEPFPVPSILQDLCRTPHHSGTNIFPAGWMTPDFVCLSPKEQWNCRLGSWTFGKQACSHHSE